MPQSPYESNLRLFMASGWEQMTIYPAVKVCSTIIFPTELNCCVI